MSFGDGISNQCGLDLRRYRGVINHRARRALVRKCDARRQRERSCKG